MGSKKDSDSYFKKFKEVDGIVSELNQENLDLDKMIEKVERGFNLIEEMEKRLSQTKEKIEKIKKEHSEMVT